MAYEDLTQIFTDPSFLLATASVLAPETAKIGGQRWRIADRLRGLAGIAEAAQGAGEDRRFSEDLAQLAQGGPPPPPPGQPPPGPPPTGPGPTRMSLPPGMTRQQMLANLSPDMIRRLGRPGNRLHQKTLDDILGGQEDAFKRKAIYDSAVPTLQAQGLDEDTVHKHAMAMAATGRGLSEAEMLKNPSVRGAEKINAEETLLRVQQEKEFEDLRGTIDRKNFDQVFQFVTNSKFNRMKDTLQRFFAGDPAGMLDYATDVYKKDNDKLYFETGYRRLPKIVLNDKGQASITYEYVQGVASPEQIQSSLTGLLGLVEQQIRDGSMPKDVGAVLLRQIGMAARNPTAPMAEGVLNAMTTYQAMLMRVQLSRGDNENTMIKQMIAEANDQHEFVKKQLQAQHFMEFYNPEAQKYAAKKEGLKAAEFRRLQRLDEDMARAKQEMNFARDAATARKIWGRVQVYSNPMRVMGLQTREGKTFQDVWNDYIKANPKATEDDKRRLILDFETKFGP